MKKLLKVRDAIVCTSSLLALVVGAMLLSPAGCTTVDSSGQAKYDPIKTADVKAAIRPLIVLGADEAFRAVKDKDALAEALRGLGHVFLDMKRTGTFSPDFLVSELDARTERLQAKLDHRWIAIKEGVIALYSVAYNHRADAELSPERWPWHVADILSAAIDAALKNAGKPGL